MAGTTRKVNLDEFGKSAPKITQDDLEGDVAILTIVAYEEIELDDPETETGKRKSATLRFEETGDKVLWLNKGQLESLVARLGDNPDAWSGKRCPVEKVRTAFRGKSFDKVSVVHADEWNDYLKPSAGKKRGRR
jgi:hypothetical protein